MEVDFSDILEKSRALRSKQEAISSGFADNIPRLERALPQIDRESRRLATAYAGDGSLAQDGYGRYDDSKALRLLSESGFRTDNIERNLQSVALMDAFEPVRSVADTDLDSYLAQAHETAIIAAVETALEDATKHSMTSIASTIEAEWESSKRDLVTLPVMHYRTPSQRQNKAASTAPGGAFASPFRSRRASVLGSSTVGAPGDFATPGLSARRPTAATPIYESVVRRAVHSRSNPNIAVCIATELDDALINHMAPRGDVLNAPKTIQHLHAVFSALRYIASEANVASSPAEGAFAGMHTSEDRRRACLGAYRFLCLQFREDKMRREIETRPIEALRGGVPGLQADVKSYLNLIFDRGMPSQLQAGAVFDGAPIWPQIYYCLRAGSIPTALEIARGALNEGCTDSSVALIEQCLEAVANSGEKRSLPHSMLTRLVQDYGLTAKRGEDPYQRVCYVVLARLDPAAGDKMSLHDSDYALLFYSIEDYLWLRLSVARFEGDDKAPDSLAMYQLSLKAIQEEMKGFGPGHFDPQGDTPAFYALVLILTGQFSEALAYLDQGARAIAEATHTAYVLYYYGILREDGQVQEDGGEWPDECFRFDFPDLLWRYISRFARTDPASAALYIFTLRDVEMRKAYLQKLLLETKEFTLLLGQNTNQRSGRDERQVGILEELWPLGGRNAVMQESWLSVVESAAVAAEEIGDRSSAIVLYGAAGVRSKVLMILVDKLSAELTSRDAPARERVFTEARAYQKQMESERGRLGLGQTQNAADVEKILPSFYMLLSLGEFFDLLWEKRFEQAWELLSRLALLPGNDSELVSKTVELRVGGGVWADGVCDRVPEVLLGGMETLAGLHSAQRKLEREGRSHTEDYHSWVRGSARTLVNFSGMVGHISADISARLVRLEVVMN